MAEFLLVHGSCHSAWCWHATIPALEALGHTARAIDLLSHGDDDTPLGDVTLDGYARAIRDALHGPTILVGHSMAGYPISRAADLDPRNITRLVYLCAYVPWPDMSLAQMRRSAPRQPLMAAVERSEDGLSFAIDPAQAPELFYHDCPAALAAEATARLGPQAIAPQETPLRLGDNWAGLPRSYILCEDDRTVPPEFQRSMADRDFAAADVHAMPTSHSPFLSDPAGLARILDMIARG